MSGSIIINLVAPTAMGEFQFTYEVEHCDHDI